MEVKRKNLDPITPAEQAAWDAAWELVLDGMSEAGARGIDQWTDPWGNVGPALRLVGMSLGVYVAQAPDALADDLARHRRPWLAVLRGALDAVELIPPPELDPERLPRGEVSADDEEPEDAAAELDPAALAKWGRG